jgi:hypothetical protein
MPLDYSQLLHAIESRARRLRGLSVASSAMGGLSLAALAAMIAVRLLRIPLSYWSLSAFVLPSLAAAALGYGLGRLGRPRIPYLLLRIDDALRLDARFSSLYELRQRGGDSIFRQRIEAEVRDAMSEWRTALPVGRRTILGCSAGACCIALAVGLAFVPLPNAAGSPLDMLAQTSTVSQDRLPDDAGSLAKPMTQPTAPSTLRTDAELDRELGVPTLDRPDRDQTLEDVMRGLSGMSPDEAVLVSTSPNEIEELARLQREAMRAITQLLEDIRDRLENSPPSDRPELTEEERDALQRELDRGGLPPEVQDGLNELMNRPRPRTVEEIVEQLIEQFEDKEQGEGEPSEGGESGPPRSTAVAPDLQDIEDLLDALGQASSDEEEGFETAVPPGPDEGEGRPEGSDVHGAPSAGDQPDGIGDPGIEDPGQTGGSEGPGGSSDEENERRTGLIREEERAKIGSEGEFASEFVTEGVPIELMPGSDGEEASFRVSYEQIVSILRERGVPEGAIEIVRDYFNAITEGGP